MPTYEYFNEKVEQRSRAAVICRRKASYKTLVKVMAPVLAALLLIAGLECIGFINAVFAVVLGAIALTTGAFQLGLVWRTLRF